MRHIARTLFVGLCAALGGFLASMSPGLVRPVSAQLAVPGARPTAREADTVQAVSDRFELVARRVSASVVAVEATKPAPPRGGKQRQTEESGSGVMIRLAGMQD